MRGPVDYIVVGFEGNKFNGEILSALQKSISDEVINVLDLAVITKNEKGEVAILDIENLGDEISLSFASSNGIKGDLIGDDDIDEVGDLLENNTSAGLLIFEHLWAKDFKKALMNANGVLVSEGRIHPDAVNELESKEK